MGLVTAEAEASPAVPVEVAATAIAVTLLPVVTVGSAAVPLAAAELGLTMSCGAGV
jgi:hypothetical protein